MEGVQADVSHPDEMEIVIQKTTNGFGDLHILVNNAGISPFSPMLDLAEGIRGACASGVGCSDEDLYPFSRSLNAHDSDAVLC